MNLYREADPWDKAYYANLPLMIVAEGDRSAFYVMGVLYQMWKLGLYPIRPLFFDSWTPLWWRLFEAKYRPDEHVENALIKKSKVDETLYLMYHSPKFFQLYEQAKNRLRIGFLDDEPSGNAPGC